MLVGVAREVTRRWVHAYAGEHPEVRGAVFTGSVVDLADDAELPATSDVDLSILVADEAVGAKLGKFRHDDVLIEATNAPWSAVADVKRVVVDIHLGPSFRGGAVALDPTGRLAEVERWVAPRWSEPEHVRRRVDQVVSSMTAGLTQLDLDRPWHELVNGWMFSGSRTTHVVLVAAGQNPTVRLRYLRARPVLVDDGQSEVYAELLEQLGCAAVEPPAVQHHLDELRTVFDVAARVARTPFFFSADITPFARVVPIDGSQELIDAGDHREAIFWVMATHARCQQILAADAPGALRRAFEPAYTAAAADLLGLEHPGPVQARADRILDHLPRLVDARLAAT